MKAIFATISVGLLAIASPLMAQTTAFTYQGQLTSGGGPATGSYDLVFELFDAAVGGNAVGLPQQLNGVPVSNGLFMVTVDFGGAGFTGESLWLQMRVSTNGAGSFDTLAPRQPITPTPYALYAPSAGTSGTAGTITGTITSSNIPNGTVTAEMIATGAVGASQLAPGAAAANLNASGQSGVASGGMVLSTNFSDTNLLNVGYVKLAKVDMVDKWSERSAYLGERYGHTAIWTGSKMIVWGGQDGTEYVTNGLVFDPSVNLYPFSGVAIEGAPSPRELHTAVWTGTEMLIWGGYSAFTGRLGDGGRYNPATSSWTPISTNGAPSPRYYHTAVWTGTEMIVWGGDAATNGAFGGRYDPVTDSWISITNYGVSFSPARYAHTAVWTGTEMIIWGGRSISGSWLNTGRRYIPASNTWSSVTTSDAPSARAFHTAIWTGSRMLVWGGNDSILVHRGDGYAYQPGSVWTPITSVGAPSARDSHTAVWTGTEMIIWGGKNGSYPTDGARYTFAADSWSPITTVGSPPARSYHTAVWSGQNMIVVGGADSSNTNLLAYLATYTPPPTLYLYLRP